MASKIKENLKKNKLGTKPTKHIEDVLILEPLDFLQKTCFRMEELQKITTKTRGMDKYEHIPKNSVEMMQKIIKHDPGTNSTKNDAWKQMPKNPKIRNKWLPNRSQKMTLF